MKIKRFTELNEINKDDYPLFKDTLKYINVDLNNYDKTKYQSVNSVTANIEWSAELKYTKSGISDLDVWVYKIDFLVVFDRADDGEEEEVEFTIERDKDDIEISLGDEAIPCYCEEIVYDFKTKKCVVSFGK